LSASAVFSLRSGKSRTNGTVAKATQNEKLLMCQKLHQVTALPKFDEAVLSPQLVVEELLPLRTANTNCHVSGLATHDFYLYRHFIFLPTKELTAFLSKS